MGPWTLVSKEEVRSGEELLHQLPVDGIQAVAALWAKTDEDGQPYLYVVSPTIDHVGPLEANLRLGRSFREVEKTWTDPFSRLDRFAIKLIGLSDPLARGVLELYHRWPDSTPTWYRGAGLGSVYVEGAYIYPASLFAPSQPQPAP
jgi:hypothetical protein